MSKFFFGTLIFWWCLISGLSLQAATYYTYVNGGSSGLWATAGTWTTDPTGLTLTGSAIPGNNDVVHILNGFAVTLGANVTTTGLTITIHNGGTLDLSTFTIATIGTLSGAGTLRIQSAYFPTITSNNFVAAAASGATVEFYDFSGTLPGSINYPNLIFTNSTGSDHLITLSNPLTYTLTIFGTLITQRTNTGALRVTLGSQATHVINVNVNGDFTIGEGTTFGVGAFNAVHALSLLGNLTNNGLLDLNNGPQYNTGTNGAGTLTFTGASDKVFACNGITELFTLTINKGLSSTNILSVTSTDASYFSLNGNGKLLTVTNGTVKLGANVNITQLYSNGSTNYDLGSETTSPMMWIDGATVDTHRSALVVYGKFRITSGSFTCVGAEGSVIREEGEYIIEGGTFTTEKFRPSTTASTHRGSFTMTGGVFNASGTDKSNGSYARFSLPYPEQVFIMSGGVINVSNPAAVGGIHIGCDPSNHNVTGGTFNAILSWTSSFFEISSTAPFWNLNISRTGGTPTTVRLDGIGGVGGTVTSAQPLTVLNDFTIEGTNSPSFDAAGKNVSIGRHFMINAGATYTPSSNTTIFDGSVDQNFTNNGIITSGLYNLTMDKPSGVLILGGTTPSYTVTQTLTLANGVLNDGGKTVLAYGSIRNDAAHSGTGNITLSGATTQTVSGNGDGIFANLILNNPSTPGAILTSDLTVSGVLTLAGTGNSIFQIDHYLLSLTSTSASAVTTSGNPFSSAKMIRTSGFQSDRGIRKHYNDLTAFTYPFGVGNAYTPATIQLTAAPASFGTIAVRPVSSRHPFIAAGITNNLSFYWKVSTSGFAGVAPSSVSHQYNYTDAFVSSPADEINYVAARYNPTAWTVINNPASVNETTNLISLSGVGYIDGDYTAGIPASFGIVKIFYSKRSGNWTDVSPGTTPWSNVSHSGADATVAPGPGDHVYIGDGATFNHTVTITSNGQSAGGLEINSGSTLDVGVSTGHNFGRLENLSVSGSGLLRISSGSATAQFPAGDFGNFIRESGGSVEYYTTGAQDFTIPLASAAPTSLPLISYKNLILTPASGRYVGMPNQNERIYGTLTVQGASSTAIVRLNAATSRTMTLDHDLLIKSGTLQFRNATPQVMDIKGNIQIDAGATFNLAGTGGAATNVITLEGSLVNNGTFDMSNTTSYVTNITFTGDANSSITGTGATTDFNILKVAKGTSQTPVLDVNATAFTLSGGSQPLVLENGTFRLSSAQSVIISNGTSFPIPATTRLSANGGTLQITGGTGVDLLLAGALEVLNGSIDVGTTEDDNSIEYAATGQPTITISGGALNIRSQVRRSSSSTQGGLHYNQSGGVATVGISSALNTTRGVFEILNPGSIFSMSGGTLAIARGFSPTSISDLYIQPASYSISGGTLEVGAIGVSQTVDINTIIPLYNLSVTGTSNTGRLEFNPLVLRGSLTIADGNVFNANSLNVSIAGNMINQNTDANTGVTTGGYRTGSISQTTTFNGSAGNQIITGLSGNLTNFGNLIVNNTFTTGSVTLSANTNLRINGSLTLSSGTVVGSTNTITAMGSVFNSSTHTSSGSGSILLQGASNQIIGGNGTGKFGNLTLNNASGATFNANQEITGTLTFTNGSLFIGPYGLNLSNTNLSSIVGASSTRYIVTSGLLSNSGVTKAFAASVTNGNFVYPIGVSGKYTPANYTLSSGASPGSITIKPVNSKHPNATGPGTAFINYYWSVSHSALTLTSLTHRYTYVAADEQGTVADYRDARFQGGAWSIGIAAGNPNTTTRVITFTNTDVTGDYTTGEATAFVNPTLYTSIGSANWESEQWTPDPPGLNLGPPAGSFVIIQAGHTITVTTNVKRMATLEVRGRLHLGTTSGHDFGVVTAAGVGSKTIQIQSSVFPSGNFAAFNAANGGTVEYDGTVVLPTQNTYNNLSFSSPGLKTLPNVDLVINGNITIAGGHATNAVNNRNIALVNATGDFTNNGTFTMGTGSIVVGRDLINSGAGATFNSGNGANGLRISRNLLNNSNATFIAGIDSIGVRGTLTNGATFTGAAGAIRVSGNFNNSAGTFTGGSGIVSITGSLTNNALYHAGASTTTVGASYLNSSASAQHNANNNSLIVAGSFSNTTGATFNANSGSITTVGNWTNTATFNAGAGSVTFASAAIQTVSGATTFHNIIRSNGGTLSLNNNIVVNGLLSLSNGKILTGSNLVSLTNTAAQPVSGHTAANFVDGRVSISFPDDAGTSRVFPVGSGTIYRPVTIQQTVASSVPVVSVRMINTPPTGTVPATVIGISPTRYYEIDLTSGTMNSPLVTLSFNTNGVADELVAVPGNLRIVRGTSSAGPWTDEGGAGVFSPASPAGYATSGITSIINPTYFTLGSVDNVLPVLLKSFEAKYRNEVVELTWTTVTEKNNAYFTVERSSNGLFYDSLLSVDGAGDSKVMLNYSETDWDPLYGISYYRLRQTDYDGATSLSNVVRVENFGRRPSAISVYPNPSTTTENIFVRMINDLASEGHLEVSNITGMVFYSGTVDLTTPLNIKDLKLNYRLEKGVYLIKIVATDFIGVQKIIIH